MTNQAVVKKTLSLEAFAGLVANRIEYYNKEEIIDILYASRDMLLDLMMEGEPVNFPKLCKFVPCVQGRNGVFKTDRYGDVHVTPKWGFKIERHQALREEFHKEAVKVRKHLRLPHEPVITPRKKRKKEMKDAD